MIKKQGSKFVVTDSSGKKTLGTHPSKEKAQKQLAAIEISKAKHMKENKSFKAFRGTLSESEYSEVLTGYGNRSAHKDDAGLHHTNSPGAMAGINGMLAAIGRGTYLDPNQAFLKIKLRLNAVLLDFDWKNGSWDGGVGTYDIPVRQYGRVDGYDAATGGIRFDGRAAPTAGLKEFTMHCEVAEIDGLYTVTASISVAGMNMVGEGVDNLKRKVDLRLLQLKSFDYPKKPMIKVGLNPNKKIGYQVTSVGPGGKRTVEKSVDYLKKSGVDEGFASVKKEIKEKLGGGGRPPVKPKFVFDIIGKGRPAGAMDKQLVGNQEKLDVNKNKRLDAQDFKMLRAKKTNAVKEESDREAEARHKRLMKMDIPGTFGDRDLREIIRRKQMERQAKRAAAKAAATKAAAKKSGY